MTMIVTKGQSGLYTNSRQKWTLKLYTSSFLLCSSSIRWLWPWLRIKVKILYSSRMPYYILPLSDQFCLLGAHIPQENVNKDQNMQLFFQGFYTFQGHCVPDLFIRYTWIDKGECFINNCLINMIWYFWVFSPF